jgi:hypothetical protein
MDMSLDNLKSRKFISNKVPALAFLIGVPIALMIFFLIVLAASKPAMVCTVNADGSKTLNQTKLWGFSFLFGVVLGGPLTYAAMWKGIGDPLAASAPLNE